MVQIKPEKVSDYEQKRLKQIDENRQHLKKLGITPLPLPVPKVTVPRKARTQSIVKKAKKVKKPLPRTTRYSLRSRETLVQTQPVNITDFNEGEFVEDETKAQPRFPAWTKGNTFGSIPGVPVGSEWDTRMEVNYCGIHRPTVAGIHGSTTEGCYSLALSGGYDDDIDDGETFTYTGSGGRDLRGTKANPKNLRTAPQTSDQKFEGPNLALKVSFEKQRPIRVIRGYKNRSPYAPLEGYRYDGLYKVVKVWQEPGKSGYLICRFKLTRLPNQPALPLKPKLEDFTEEI